jgi:predicted aspartyl protease
MRTPGYLAAKAIIASYLVLAALAAKADTCEFRALQEIPLFQGAEGKHLTVAGSINRQPATMLVDTGASITLLTPKGVEKHKLTRRIIDAMVEGSGGLSRLHRATINELVVGPFTAERMMLGVVHEMAETEYELIVGSDLWMQADLELDVPGKTLRLFRNIGCKPNAFLAYWDAKANTVPLEFASGDPRPRLKVTLNGIGFDAIIDTGAPSTTIFRRTAERLGLRPSSESNTVNIESGGVGSNRYRVFEAAVTLGVGDKYNTNLPIFVADTDGQTRNFEVLLGLDWLRTHRVLIANSQRRLYFSGSPTAVVGSK